MAQTGRTRRRRLTGLLLLLMTMTIMMTVQYSNSLVLVQVAGCMSHAKIWNNRSSKLGKGSDWTCAGHTDRNKHAYTALRGKVCASKYYPICQKLGSGLGID